MPRSGVIARVAGTSATHCASANRSPHPKIPATIPCEPAPAVPRTHYRPAVLPRASPTHSCRSSVRVGRSSWHSRLEPQAPMRPIHYGWFPECWTQRRAAEAPAWPGPDFPPPSTGPPGVAPVPAVAISTTHTAPRSIAPAPAITAMAGHARALADIECKAARPKSGTRGAAPQART